MKAVLQPITDAIDQLAKGITANRGAITKLTNKKPAEAAPIIPKELTDVLAKVVPPLIKELFKAFTEPDTSPAAASKGIFGETMQKAYEASMIKTWNATADLQELAVETAKLENKLRAKRLDEEI